AEYGADGEACAEALADGDEVGDDAAAFTGEPPAGAPESADHLVGDEDGAVLFRHRLHPLEELRRRDDVASGALHGLDDDGGQGSRGLMGELLAREVGAGDVASRVRQLERAAVAIRVRQDVSGWQGPVAALVSRSV